MKLEIILLAAGNSRRFGGNKLLHILNGQPMYRYGLKCLKDAARMLEEENENRDNGEILTIKKTVVTQYKEIAGQAEQWGFKVLYNKAPERGISSSLKIALEAGKDADAWLFCVADQPWLLPSSVCRLVRGFLTSEKGIACVSCEGQLGNPCIFTRAYEKELMCLEGDVGGKKVIRAHQEDVFFYPVAEKRQLQDIDYQTHSRQ